MTGVMKMSKNFNLIKKFYDDKLWNKKRIRDAVIKKKITEEEYESITGEMYGLE